MSAQNQLTAAQSTLSAIRAELHKTIVGQNSVIDDLLAGFLAGGNCLLVGVPGLAKTLLVKSLAECLHLSFNRVQFTPDLMPSDITGSEILFEDRVSGHREFRFVNGPVFCNILLADEINRTPPKTQSALLQAMQEQAVTCGGKTYSLPDPFWVLATQNPIEQEGTYPLPEAQQDRFMFSIDVGYPDFESEVEIVKRTTGAASPEVVPVVTAGDISVLRALIRDLPVADSVISFAVRMARATRPEGGECPADVIRHLSWGAGPRASQFLILAAKSYALLDGRPTPDTRDVVRASLPVLRHRIIRSFNAEADGVSVESIISTIVGHL